jgi:hypothetical protein
MTISFLLFILQVYIIPYTDSNQCIHAVCWFWICWILSGILWPNKMNIYDNEYSFFYWSISSLQCFFGLEAHYRHTMKNNSDIDKNEILILFGKYTQITRQHFENMLTVVYCLLFIIFPHQSSIFTKMIPVEAFLRPVIMYGILCSILMIHTCSRKNIQWDLLLRECSWVCLANPACIIFFLVQVISIVFSASNCFSFVAYTNSNENDSVTNCIRKQYSDQNKISQFKPKPLRQRSLIKLNPRFQNKRITELKNSELSLTKRQADIQRLMKESENVIPISNQ